MRSIRNGLYGAGVVVECSKGEASAGQEEINVQYSDALDMADTHVFVKNACKEISWSQGKALSFMAKWHNKAAGNSCHIHQSLWSVDGRKSLFQDKKGVYGMSETMRQYMAGLLHNADAITWFLAPYVNSYKRFAEGTFAPTRAVWSCDNRTAGYRLCGDGTKAVRVECRIGGADLNPYLAYAALLSAGLDGIENKRELEDEFRGDAYVSKTGAIGSAHPAGCDRGHEEIEDAPLRHGRRRDRSLRSRRRMGAGRIRSPRDRLGSRSRI